MTCLTLLPIYVASPEARKGVIDDDESRGKATKLNIVLAGAACASGAAVCGCKEAAKRSVSRRQDVTPAV